jgi:transposase
MGDKEVILNVNRRRFKCKKCRKTFSEELDFVGTRKGYTHRYAENLVQQIINSNVSNVARNNGLTDEEVNSMPTRRMKYLVDERYPEADKIGVIQDQLNTHVQASFYKAFEPSEATLSLNSNLTDY